MKKAIIALLTTILAAFGYVAVDKTIEQRVSNLESQVSSQEEVIQSLHGMGKYSIELETTSVTSTTEEPSRIYFDPFDYIGVKQNYEGRKKIGFTFYSDGVILRDNEKYNPVDGSKPVGVYYIYITEASRTLYSVTDYTEKPDDFCSIYGTLLYSFEISGHVDSELIGRTVTISGQSAVIEESGNFKIVYDASNYEGNFYGPPQYFSRPFYEYEDNTLPYDVPSVMTFNHDLKIIIR